MPGARVLVIEDDPAIRRILQTGLTVRGGYAVDIASGGREGLERLRQEQPDVVVLDLVMPDLDGTEVLQQLREWSRVPVIVLSALREQELKVRALELGADDYVTKPFGLEELVARIKVALRHAGGTDPIAPRFSIGDLVIDFDRRRVTLEGRLVPLTPTEYGLLKTLAQDAGKVITHRTLLRSVWGPEYEAAAHYLHVYMARLRRKLEPDTKGRRYVRTEQGAGYRLWVEDDEEEVRPHVEAPRRASLRLAGAPAR